MSEKQVEIELKEVKLALKRMQDMVGAMAVCIEAIEAANAGTLKPGKVDAVDNVANPKTKWYTLSEC